MCSCDSLSFHTWIISGSWKLLLKHCSNDWQRYRHKLSSLEEAQQNYFSSQVEERLEKFIVTISRRDSIHVQMMHRVIICRQWQNNEGVTLKFLFVAVKKTLKRSFWYHHHNPRCNRMIMLRCGFCWVNVTLKFQWIGKMKYYWGMWNNGFV